MRASAGEIDGRITLLQEAPDSGSWRPAESHTGAVVYLNGIDRPPPKNRQIYLDQKDKLFRPRVLAITAGETVTFRNRDPVHHNVWSVSPAHSFDLGSYKAPAEKTVTFNNPGLIRIFCNIHPQMIASILVLKNHFHAVTADDGTFAIRDIPPGKYELRVWVEGSEPDVKPVVVTAKSKTSVNFSVKTTPLGEDHLNKEGKPYDRTY